MAERSGLLDEQPPHAQEGGRGTAAGGPARIIALPIGLVQTARPRQWIKNVLVAAAPAAAGELFHLPNLTRLALVFVLVTAAASGVYLINDARDAEADREHPTKCRRPVAAGRVPVAVAYAAGGLLVAATPAVALATCNTATAGLLGAYVVMQLAYCLHLKNVLVLDLSIVTCGFLMRAMAGGLALGIPLSRWFLIATGFGALFMVAGKRYSEAVEMAGRRGETRALLREYTVGYLRFVWQLAAGGAVLAYCLWALEDGNGYRSALPWQQLSMVPFVLGVLRYAVFTDAGKAGAPEEVVLRDRALILTGLLWLVLYGMAVADV